MQIEVADSRNLLGERISRELRKRYGAHAAKQAAQITGSDLRTAQGWISEHREPRGAAFLAIIRELGKDGIISLFSPEIEQHTERMKRQLNDLREETRRLEAQLGIGGPAPARGLAETASEPTHGQGVNQDRDGERDLSERRILRRRKDDR